MSKYKIRTITSKKILNEVSSDIIKLHSAFKGASGVRSISLTFESKEEGIMKDNNQFNEVFNRLDKIDKTLDILVGFMEKQMKFNEEQMKFNEEQMKFNQRIETKVDKIYALPTIKKELA